MKEFMVAKMLVVLSPDTSSVDFKGIRFQAATLQFEGLGRSVSYHMVTVLLVVIDFLTVFYKMSS